MPNGLAESTVTSEVKVLMGPMFSVTEANARRDDQRRIEYLDRNARVRRLF
jgi:hypothetical protein